MLTLTILRLCNPREFLNEYEIMHANQGMMERRTWTLIVSACIVMGGSS